MQVMPSASNRFKRSDNVVLYTEIYDQPAALVSERHRAWLRVPHL